MSINVNNAVEFKLDCVTLHIDEHIILENLMFPAGRSVASKGPVVLRLIPIKILK